MSLQLRLYLLLGLLLAILYAIILAVSRAIGFVNFGVYAIIAVGLVFLQYLIGPAMVGLIMRVRYVSEQDEPDLHRMVAELAGEAGIKKPRIGISEMAIPNAFAFGRTRGDARICVTRGIMGLLNRDELKAVLGHEMTHVKNRDMLFITLLSVLPLICYYIAMSFLWSGMFGGRSRSQGGANILPLIGIGMLILYFITNLLVLYGSRIREYYADRGSVQLGNRPRYLATALYKLSYGNARINKEDYKRVEGVKAFFVNDPSRALREVRELREIDTDMSGTIDTTELEALRGKAVRPGFGDRLMELFSTHPNMLKRIKHLSTLTFGQTPLSY
jgi:heat shock protein HtpX